MMKKKLSILIGISLVIILAVSGCATAPAPSPESSDESELTSTGTVRINVTDAPAKEVTSIMVTISEVSVHLAGAVQEQEQEQSEGGQVQEQEQEQQQSQQGQGGWLAIEIANDDKSFDLFDVAGIEQFLGESEVTAGKYTQIRLTIETVEVALGDGVLQPATVPSGVLKFVRPFDVVDGGVTEILIDFDAEKSVTVTGAGKILVKPVVKLTVEGESSAGQPEEDEDAEELEFEGTIDAIEDSIWTMTIDGETMTVDVSGAEIDGEAAVGLEAEIKGTVVDDVIIASEAEIREAEEEVVEELEYEGTIDAIEDSIWTMTVDDETMTVDVSGAEIEGEAVVGLEAEVKGTVVDDVLIASEAEIREAEEEEEVVEELEFEGTIDAIEGTVWMMTFDGETMTVDVSGAEIDGEAVVGLEAEVKGIVVDDVLIASEVEIREAVE
ncbi:DUF4382 domain-containing protein [Chloroflexota bacterium]